MTEQTNEPTQRTPKTSSDAKAKAKAALENRSKKSSDAIYYWMVLGGFVIVCLVCVFYVFREWRESPNLIPAVDSKAIEQHNARQTSFQRGANKLFAVL